MAMVETFRLLLMAAANMLLLLPTSALGFMPIGVDTRSTISASVATATSSSSTKCIVREGGTSLMMATQLSPRQYLLQGMEEFRQGDVAESIKSFDASVPPGITKPYLWQRGISYYYVDEFQKASQQFRDDVLQSPLDVEEIVWDIACLTRIDNTRFPPPNKLSLPRGKQDRRPIMVRKNFILNSVAACIMRFTLWQF